MFNANREHLTHPSLFRGCNVCLHCTSSVPNSIFKFQLLPKLSILTILLTLKSSSCKSAVWPRWNFPSGRPLGDKMNYEGAFRVFSVNRCFLTIGLFSYRSFNCFTWRHCTCQPITQGIFVSHSRPTKVTIRRLYFTTNYETHKTSWS